MSHRTKTIRPPTPPTPPSSNGNQSGNQPGKNNSSYILHQRYQNSNRRRHSSGSKSPPPVEPTIEPIEKSNYLVKPKTNNYRPKPVLTQEKLEAKTPSVPSTPTPTPSPPPPVQNKFVFKPKTEIITPKPNPTSTEYIKHFSIKTMNSSPPNCHFCEGYILRPHVETNCCGKAYHPECLSMLYTDTLSFDFKNGNTMPLIYFSHECGFSSLDKDGRNSANLTKIYNYFELGIKA